MNKNINIANCKIKRKDALPFSPSNSTNNKQSSDGNTMVPGVTQFSPHFPHFRLQGRDKGEVQGIILSYKLIISLLK